MHLILYFNLRFSLGLVYFYLFINALNEDFKILNSKLFKIKTKPNISLFKKFPLSILI